MTKVRCRRKWCESYDEGRCEADEISIDYHDGCEMYEKREKIVRYEKDCMGKYKERME